MTFSSDELQAAAKQHLWMHFTRMSSYNDGDIPVIVRGSGPYVYDDKGKRYLDGLAGLFVSMVGHGRTELADRLRGQLGAAVALQLADGQWLRGTVAGAGPQWLLLDLSDPAGGVGGTGPGRGAGAAPRQVLVPTAALQRVTGLSAAVGAPVGLVERRLGLASAPTDALRGADAAYNAQVVHEVFAGRRGPVRDAVVLNAGVALALAADADTDVHDDIRAGIQRASAAIDSGAAVDLVRRWVAAAGQSARPS